MVAEENKRRTIQRSDIANAIARSDLFDFLIDIVPRSDIVRGRSSSVPVRNIITPMQPTVGRVVDGTNFMPMRAPHAPRLDDEVKGMQKEMPGEWSASPMYPIAMGDSRLHHAAQMGMPHAPGGAPVMHAHGPPRGSFLNMMSYSVPNEPKGDVVGE